MQLRTNLSTFISFAFLTLGHIAAETFLIFATLSFHLLNLHKIEQISRCSLIEVGEKLFRVESEPLIEGTGKQLSKETSDGLLKVDREIKSDLRNTRHVAREVLFLQATVKTLNYFQIHRKLSRIYFASSVFAALSQLDSSPNHRRKGNKTRLRTTL